LRAAGVLTTRIGFFASSIPIAVRSASVSFASASATAASTSEGGIRGIG
jgi:hypothetical protein